MYQIEIFFSSRFLHGISKNLALGVAGIIFEGVEAELGTDVVMEIQIQL